MPHAAILVQKLGRDGFLKHTAPDPEAPAPLDVRTLCLIRETLARHDALGDFAFAMQGLGAGPISLFGNQPAARLAQAHALRRGDRRIRADRTEIRFGCRQYRAHGSALRHGLCARWREDLDLQRRYRRFLHCVWPHWRGARRERPLRLFWCPAKVPGFSIAERLETISPHPLARLKFERVCVPATAMIGAPGDGFKIAMATLDIFRSTVAAAAPRLRPPRTR